MVKNTGREKSVGFDCARSEERDAALLTYRIYRAHELIPCFRARKFRVHLQKREIPISKMTRSIL